MESNAYKLIRNNRKVRLTVGIAGTLLLGALGSGLWELVLRDILVLVGNATLTFISSNWGGYVDLLHRDIGKLRQDSLMTPVFALTMVFIMFGPWVMIVSLLRRSARLKDELAEDDTNETITSEQLAEEVSALRKAIFRILIPVIVVATFFYAVFVWQITYTRNAANWADRSTEILLPYITQQEYMKLRSDLRVIEDAEHFYRLEKQLQDFAAKVSIKLPVFTVIGKRSGT